MDVTAQEIQSMKEIVDLAVNIPRFTYEMFQQAPRPTGPYAAVKCLSSVNPAFDEVRMIELPDGTDAFRSRGVRILTFAILFLRMGDEYINFDNAFYRPDIIEKMKASKFAAMGKEALNLQNVQLETNWEVRHGIKMQFNVFREHISSLGVMSSAQVGGKFIDGQQTLDIQG